MQAIVNRFRIRRWCHVWVAVLRILIGFAFLPAGLKKSLGGPFTDPSNVGTFHDFLHGFHATGVFYNFVGWVQVVVAVLLMTQRFATLGAALALPLFSAIMVFCWSTNVPFTATMVTLMWLGVVSFILWDWHRFKALWGKPGFPADRDMQLIEADLWERCGLAVVAAYVAIVAVSGGVYRPKGLEWGNPAFWTLPVLALTPLVTYGIERRRRKGRSSNRG